MEIRPAVRLLEVLVENSLQILATGFGMNWPECSFLDVIMLLKQDALRCSEQPTAN